MSQDALDALEAWHATTRALRQATPGTAEWVRLRMIAGEQHAAYESLISEADSPGDVSSGASARSEVPEQRSR